jgi:hypothetical protein
MPELVAKTSAAVAVDENLTVLLDWVNIESVSGFTLVVDNAGGGSANDITDVQIDTSDDGGITSSLDQHAGVPTVPIASGEASQGTFTETAAFVRVRALCAAGQDTTADAHLLADSVTGRICTLTDVKDRLGISDTEHDAAINRIISGLESIFDGHTKHNLLVNAADVTEYYSGLGTLLQLARFPIVSITSIKIAYDYAFDSADALTADSDYRKIAGGENGILYRINLNWPENQDAIQVIYRGGYCSAGQTPGTGEYALPADLREAAIEQASFFFKRRDDLGLAGVSFEGGSISKFSSMDLLPMVKKILDNYRKPSL